MQNETVFSIGEFRVSVGRPCLVGRSRGYFWFPTVTTFESGAILATAYAGEDGLTMTPAGLYVWSNDNGDTWSAPAPAPFSEVALTVSGQKTLLLPFALRQSVGRENAISGPVLRADDKTLQVIAEGEATVSQFPRCLASVKPGEASGWAFNGQTLRNATDTCWLATLYGTFAGDSRHSLLLAESVDGNDWRIRSIIADANICSLPGADGPCESSLVRLFDGSLLCIFRLEARFENVYKPGSKLSYRPYARSRSYDDGLTWTEAQSMPEEYASVQPCLLALPGGGLALSGGRPGVRLWLCADSEARGWQSLDIAAHHNGFNPNEPIRTPEQTTSYTELAMLSDGSLILVYDRVPFGWRAISEESMETNSIWCVRLRIKRA